MSIKKSFLAIAVAVIGLLAAIFYLMTLEVQNQGALAEAEARHYASYKLSDELRQSSDDLTRMARTYVVTGDPVYEEYFRRILAIRNGDAPRPGNYGVIYWDLLTATGEKPGPDGEPVALQTLMSRMHFTTEEFAKLRESQDNSDALVALEERAMAAVKGLYEDADGLYTVRGEADMALARELLHGPDYHLAKAGIMAPVAEFTTMVENRTSREIDILRARADLLMRNTLGLMGLVVALLVLGFFLLRRRVTRPVVELAAAANRAENGDYSARVEVKSNDEIGALAGAFNHMATAIESDITNRKLANEELTKVSQAVESSPASVVITDLDGSIEYVNPKFTTVTGYTSAEVIGKNPRVLNSGKQSREFYENLWGSITSGQEWHGEFCNRNKNGELYWEMASISPIRDAEGKITHFVAVKEDVTERKAIEHELQHTNFLNDQALGLTKAGYWHVPLDGSGYYNSSKRAVGIFGDIPNENNRYRVMEDWFANVEAGDLEASKLTWENFQDAIDGKVPAYDSVYAYKRPVDGAVVWIRAYGTVARDSEGNATDMYGVTQDVTEYVHAQQALKLAKEAADDANQAKSTFLANMSHELRTPMNAILGYSEMLMEEAEDLEQEEFIPDLKKINQAGNHLLSLINDVLDLAKIEAGKIELFAEDIDIGGLVDEVVGTAEPLMAKNNNQVKLERDEQLGAARQDLTKLRQSLYNLLSNAAKFTREGTVTLQAKRTQSDGADWLTFTISDTGIGIPADKLGQVFEEFTQADGSTTRDYGGTGLGLAISRRFCIMMGGDITVRSQMGEGSAFTIRIPAIAPSAAVPAAPSQAAPAKTDAELDTMLRAAPGCTVLVIDDDAEAREIIERFLKKDGFEVMTAASGEEGLRIAHRIKPAAITLDVMMPDMDGWSVLRALKADPDLHDTPVVMVTMVDDKTKGYSLGATDYLTKPVNRDQLLKILGRYHCADDVCAVLVVEDDEKTRELLARTLEKEDWDVMQAGNGREALEQMSQIKPDLILLDLMMPVMDGFDFLLAMRGNPAWKDIPVIVVTAKDLTADDRRILSGKVEQVLEKGAYNQQQLLALVHNVVATAEDGQGSSG